MRSRHIKKYQKYKAAAQAGGKRIRQVEQGLDELRGQLTELLGVIKQAGVMDGRGSAAQMPSLRISMKNEVIGWAGVHVVEVAQLWSSQPDNTQSVLQYWENNWADARALPPLVAKPSTME